MDRTLAWKIPLIVVVVGLATLLVASRRVRKGIDIAGGVSLLYEIQTEEMKKETLTDLTERTMSVVRRRLDPGGVRELTIRAMGGYSFEIQMPKPPGADDQDVRALVEEAKRKVGRIGRLEFRLLADDETERVARETAEAPDGCKWYPVAKDAQDKLDSRAEILVRIDDGFDLTGSYLDSVAKGLDDNMRPAVRFTFNDRGGKRFSRLTGRNVGKHLAIILDGQVQSAPVIKSRIESRGIIEGGRSGFTPQEQKELVDVLNAGSLEAPLKLLSEKEVGGQVAEENIQRAIRAIVWAGILVFAFMAVYYLLAGLVADFALALNLLLVLAVMSLVEATLTLPGMAGLVLTVGMAVDANVLIFERIREEKRTHLALPLAIKNGYDRAFRTILDANVTTVIAALTLVLFASEAIKGFGITLSLGLLCSMFTALFVTRTIFNGLAGGGVLKGLPMLRLVRETRINFVGLRRPAVMGSLVVIALGLFLFLRRPMEENLDMDFTGGTAVGFTLKEPMERDEVQRRLAEAGYPKASAQRVRRPDEETVGKSLLVTVRKRLMGFSLIGSEAVPAAATQTASSPRSFAGGLRSTVSLDPAVPEAELQTRIAKAAERITIGEGPFGDYQITVSTAAQDGTVAEFVLLTRRAAADAVRGLLDRAFTDAEVEAELVSDRILEAFSDVLPTRQVRFGLTPESIPKEVQEDTGSAKRFAGGLCSTVTLSPAIPRQELDDRLARALERRKAADEPFGEHAVEFPAPASDTIASFVLYSRETDEGQVRALLIQAFTTSPFTEVYSFGPKVAEGMKRDALMAIGISLVLMLIYIRVRFGRWMYGLGAIVALVHDVLVTLAFISLGYVLAPTAVGRVLLLEDFKINLVLVAAFLTIIGYSINDTIVIFDRIRENLGTRKDRRVTPELVNDSVNQVLSRTLLTSLTTLLVLLTLYIFGGVAVHRFAFAMMVGVLVGTYSSIYIAPPFLLGWALPEPAAAAVGAADAGRGSGGKKGTGKKNKK